MSENNTLNTKTPEKGKDAHSHEPEPGSVDDIVDRLEELIGVEKRNIFISGGGGTGKSYLSREISERFWDKTVAKTASTGLAALNIGGLTIHSWSGIGIENDPKKASSIVRSMGYRTRERIRDTDVLIIDEVSMIRGDTFDLVDEVLKHVRAEDHPEKEFEDIPAFGGIVVVCVGDMLQLPPVRSNKFIFESNAYKALDFVHVRLRYPHRFNKDPSFFNLLQRVRRGEHIPEDVEMLTSRVVEPDADLSIDGVEPTRLYSKHAHVDEYNSDRLRALEGDTFVVTSLDGIKIVPGKEMWPSSENLETIYTNVCGEENEDDIDSERFDGHKTRKFDTSKLYSVKKHDEDDDDHEEKEYTSKRSSRTERRVLGEQTLTHSEVRDISKRITNLRSNWLDRVETRVQRKFVFKIGAQVMVTYNDKDIGVVNGSRGVIVGVDIREDRDSKERLDGIIVRVVNVETKTTSDVVVRPIMMRKWNNMSHVRVRFERTQFPLKIAYAITIHKSQSTSIDYVVTNLNRRDIFSPGMAYVALSRCKSLNGLNLLSFNPKCIYALKKCVDFDDEIEKKDLFRKETHNHEWIQKSQETQDSSDV